MYQLFYGIIMKIKIGHFQEIRFLQMKNLEILLNAGTIRNTITSLVKLLKDSRYKAVYYLNHEYFLKVKYLIELKL